jgi:hypothetical protein
MTEPTMYPMYIFTADNKEYTISLFTLEKDTSSEFYKVITGSSSDKRFFMVNTVPIPIIYVDMSEEDMTKMVASVRNAVAETVISSVSSNVVGGGNVKTQSELETSTANSDVFVRKDKLTHVMSSETSASELRGFNKNNISTVTNNFEYSDTNTESNISYLSDRPKVYRPKSYLFTDDK